MSIVVGSKNYTETTELRVVVEIRRFKNHPIFFKGAFIGGSMIEEVLILNPDDKCKWLCIPTTGMKKLPTKKWCSDFVDAYRLDSNTNTATIINLPREIDPGKVVWRGLVEESRINSLIELFAVDQFIKELTHGRRRTQGYGRNNGD